MKKITAKTKIIKFISSLLIISTILPTVLFSIPKKANAILGAGDVVFDVPQTILKALGNVFLGTSAGANYTDTAISVKNVAIEVGKQVLRAAARRALQEITKSTINWINSGFHGSPLFLENPQSFFQDIVKYEVRNVVDTFGYDSLRYPYGKAFALNTIGAYKRTLEDNASYSLSKFMTESEANNYRTNFDVGGWNGFLINTQYPQNNYLGFQMIANEQLALRITSPVVDNAITKVQTLLDQGQGFLSPETCADNNGNNEYNKVQANAWRRPSFDEVDFNKRHKDDDPTSYGIALAQEQAKWAKDNTCKNLVNTTPGSVVATQVTTAMGSQFRQSELGAAMGNSLSAVFDALLNKFIDEGLNSLASKTNPPPVTEDNWSYDGQTLGSPVVDGTNSAWDSGPEVPIVLDDFKKQLSGRTLVTTTDTNGATTTTEKIGNTGIGKYVPGDIANTEKEIQLMSEITNFLGQIWPKARELDVCIPGPDMGWQDRLQKEADKNSRKLQSLLTTNNGKEAAEAELAFKELQFATSYFKDWINNKMITELPSSVFFMEAVNDIKELSQQSNELTDAKRVKNQALARLRAVQTALATITVQPSPGSALEKTLISLKKQYDGTRTTIATTASLSDRQNELDIAKDKFESLKKLIDPSNPLGCPTERKVKGWGLPGGWQSSFSGTAQTQKPKVDGIAANSEQALFCSLPIIGGYDHESFKNTTGITYPEIPLVNAKKILRYEVTTVKSFLSSLPGNHSTAAYVNIQMSCSAIFNAKLLDYKGNLPGLTTVIETFVKPPDDTGIGNLGTCTYSDGSTDPGVTQDDCALNNGTWSADSGNSSPGIPLPSDAGTKHGNHASEVATAKNTLISSGKTFSPTTSACDRFEITKQAARLISGAGLLNNPGGNSCMVGGVPYAVDVISFSDGYIYNVLDENASDGNGPIWNPASCGASGTCPENYRPAI